MTNIGKKCIINPEFMQEPYEVGNRGIFYDAGKFREQVEKLRLLKGETDNFPEEIKERVLQGYESVVKLTLEASRVIHGPIVDQEKLKLVISTSNDYHTDMDRLESLIDVFKLIF